MSVWAREHIMLYAGADLSKCKTGDEECKLKSTETDSVIFVLQTEFF